MVKQLHLALFVYHMLYIVYLCHNNLTSMIIMPALKHIELYGLVGAATCIVYIEFHVDWIIVLLSLS